MKKITILSLASLFSFLMLSSAHAGPRPHAISDATQGEEAHAISDLHQKVKGKWKLLIINGKVPVGYPDLEISDTTFSAGTGCNQVGGGLAGLSEDYLQSDGFYSTRMLCADERGVQEDQISQTLKHTTVLSYDEVTGVLTIGSEENTLVFKRES